MTDIDKDWCLNMAALEGDAEIGAGSMSLMHPWEEAKARITAQAAEIEAYGRSLELKQALIDEQAEQIWKLREALERTALKADGASRKRIRAALAGKAEQ